MEYVAAAAAVDAAAAVAAASAVAADAAVAAAVVADVVSPRRASFGPVAAG